jgi:hypothetical protein
MLDVIASRRASSFFTTWNIHHTYINNTGIHYKKEQANSAQERKKGKSIQDIKSCRLFRFLKKNQLKLKLMPAGLTRELLDLNAQLESMGGGDTRISPLSLYTRVRPPKGPNAASNTSGITIDGNVVKLTDPRAPESALIEKAQRAYEVSCAIPFHSNQYDTYSAIGVSALESMWDGFNTAGWSNPS